MFDNQEDLLFRCLEIEEKLLAMKMGYGDSVEKGFVPWQISPEAFAFTPGEISKIEALGQGVLSFYQTMIRLYQKHIWIRQLLDVGKPLEVLKFQQHPLAQGELPRLFRVDLMMTPERNFKVVELSLKPGGSVITAAAQEAYREYYPGQIAGRGMFDQYQRLAEEGGGVARFIVPDEKLEKWVEFNSLAVYLRKKGMDAEVVTPDKADIKPGCFVFSYLPPRTWPKYLPAIPWREAGIWTPPAYVFLKEKALITLLHEKRLKGELKSGLGADYGLLMEHFIPNFLVRGRRGIEINGQQFTWQDVIKDRRRWFLKVSGFSSKASGCIGAIYGGDIGNGKWKALLQQAVDRASQRKELYVLQPVIDGLQVPVRYANSDFSAIEVEARYLRILAYFFVFEGRAELGGIEVNTRKRIKVHLQTDATSTAGIVKGE